MHTPRCGPWRFSVPFLDLVQFWGRIRFGLLEHKSVFREKRRNSPSIPASFHYPNLTNIAAPGHSWVCHWFTSGGIVQRPVRRFPSKAGLHVEIKLMESYLPPARLPWVA